MASQLCCRLCQARGDGKTRVVADVMMVLGPRGHPPLVLQLPLLFVPFYGLLL